MVWAYNGSMDLIQVGQPPPESEGKSGSAIDPVCGMTVDVARAAEACEHEGNTYYFCSGHCLTKFKADPAAYLGENRRVTQALGKHPHPSPLPGGEGERKYTSAIRSEKYTCPMHPEVVQDGPGACPKCGMALEPMTPTAS